MKIGSLPQRFLEDNIELLEKDETEFFRKLIEQEYLLRLNPEHVVQLLSVLHMIGIDLTSDIAEDLGYDRLYTNYDAKETSDDYLKLLQNLVQGVPNQYIDKTYFKGLDAYDVMTAIEDALQYRVLATSNPEDRSSDVHSVRIECFVLGEEFDAIDRYIGVQVIVETSNDIGVIELEPFSSVYLFSFGYMIDTKVANNTLLDYKKDIEHALSSILRE